MSTLHSHIDINIERDEAEIRSYMTKLSNNSFAHYYPNLIDEWHYNKNGSLTPYKVKPHSDILVWWQCPICNNEYRATVGSRSYGTSCPKCGITKSAKKRSKRVAMCNTDTKEILRVFNSISEASRVTKINASNISMVCSKQRPNAGGYYWIYVSENQTMNYINDIKNL